MKSLQRSFIIALAASLLLATPSLRAAAPADHASAERLFTLKVLPLLKDKCFACHGDDPKKIKGNLNMLTREGMLKGGEVSNKVLVPGNAKASDLFVAVTWEDEDLEMPPKENDRLTMEQIELVRAWIDAGAPWPGEAVQKKLREAEWAVESNEDGMIVKTSGGLADAWTYRRYKPEDIWGFQPVPKAEGLRLKAEATLAQDSALSLTPSALVDHFIAAKLAKTKTQPAAPADPRTLIRRATFDLHGLPPTPEETSAFLAA